MNKRDLLQKRLSIAMKRESENALCRYLLDLNIEAKDAANTPIKVRSLLKYLKEEHKRWLPLNEDLIDTHKSTMVMAMHNHLLLFRKKVEDLEELMEMQAERKDILDVSTEDQVSASCSCEES